MRFPFSKKLVLISSLIVLVTVATLFILPEDKIDFNTQVKPILNRKCISCHGGVKQKGGFSVLFREEALGNTESGKPAIIPGKPGKSELIRRITETDPDERMPYKHDPLSKEEIRILKRWIKQGAEWGDHWAYVAVKQEEVPDHSNEWIRNDIDQFIYQKLKDENLEPAEEADKGTILRRVSLDLTGLPPSDSIAQKFLNDPSDKAYENLVDELLKAPGYGERWTALWMDLARYADTRGYESDQARFIWQYRDWLINAFNTDKPYNVFLTEQLAGDLMPGADDDKYLATAFHRNTMTNNEGGTDNEEFRTSAVLDRVNTTWSALMGTTFNCVQCHSHPYDPFKHDEYYKFMAFFNNSRDEDTDMDYPLLRNYDSAHHKEKLDKLMGWLQQNASADKVKEYYTFLRTEQPSVNASLCDEFTNAYLFGYTGIRNNGTCRLPGIILNNKTEITFRYLNNNDSKWSIYLDSLKGKPLAVVPLVNTKGIWKVQTASINPTAGKHDLYFRYFNPSLKSPDEPGVLFDWFHFSESFPGAGKPGYELAKDQFNELLMAQVETTPVMMENNEEQFRSTHVFERGNWLVKGNEVTPDVPHALNPMPANAPKNRLGLALWLTDKKNPLTSRTMVNRLWEQLFGFGLVETLEDMGTQGMPPTHRELLDHLSWKFMNDYNWSMKRLLKEIVMSATYRQTSKVNEELLKKDPYNKWYARGPRIRLSAEQLRDQGLAVSNLLSKKMFGKSVMPFQPDGIWRSPYNGDVWKTSEGEDQFRRALYTYWKRTAPYPSMITFDGGAREVCTIRRIRTNTPLQALTTLNDSAYLVIARYFAYRMQRLGGIDVKKQLQKGYEAMMYKPVPEIKFNALFELYNKALVKFKDDTNATCEIIGVNDENNKPETAALVVVANAMLNLDEWVNKN